MDACGGGRRWHRHGQTRMNSRLLLAVVLCITACTVHAQASPPADTSSAGVAGVQPRHLQAEFWIAAADAADALRLDRAGVEAQNARMRQHDASVRDIERMPATLPRATVGDWVKQRSRLSPGPLYDEQGVQLTPAARAAITANVDSGTIPAQQATRYGLVTRRADLRTFPTTLRVFSTRGDTDIDRFQESALFPGTPVAIVHQSQDGEWWFVVSALYAAWVEKRAIAEGPAGQVFGYGRKTPYLVVTAATLRSVYTREQPQVSELQLDMGVRVPVLADWPATAPVNGQGVHAGHVIELPIRKADGALAFSPALLPQVADVAPDYLPFTRAALLRQAFKFLGERYGWGHAFNGRDCSGFVSEVYRSVGVLLPRNTSDQAVSPALDRLAFDANSDRASRLAAVRDLQVGDLVYIPGHVMMVIGFDQGEPYVIHDTTGINVRGPGGELQRHVLNGVSVTPLLPLLFSQDQTYIERMTSIQRIRPQAHP